MSDNLIQRLQWCQSKANEAAQTSSIAAKRYEAHMSLYSVSAMSGDTEGMNSNRDMLHVLLDQILDSAHGIGLYQTEIYKLVEQLNNVNE